MLVKDNFIEEQQQQKKIKIVVNKNNNNYRRKKKKITKIKFKLKKLEIKLLEIMLLIFNKIKEKNLSKIQEFSQECNQEDLQ